MTGEPTRRLFFGLWPDGQQRAALLEATRKVVRGCGGRPVPGENLHVTLAFLGAVASARIEELCVIARRCAAGFSSDAVPIVLTFEDVAHWTKAQVLAVLAADPQDRASSADARSLAATLTSETAGAGFGPDLKPFRAHVTVARKVARAPRASAIRPVDWRFDRFALLESRTLETGPVYSVVESYALSDSEKLRI